MISSNVSEPVVWLLVLVLSLYEVADRMLAGFLSSESLTKAGESVSNVSRHMAGQSGRSIEEGLQFLVWPPPQGCLWPASAIQEKTRWKPQCPLDPSLEVTCHAFHSGLLITNVSPLQYDRDTPGCEYYR